jgi:hypothetical protein
MEAIMDNLYAKISIKRIEKLMENQNQYDNPSDMIADIIHWCKANDVSFEETLNRAYDYVESDLEEEILAEDDGA